MMMYAAVFFIVLLAAGLLALGWRAYQNHLEISRLRRNGYRRVAARRQLRGGVHPEFLRVLAELGLLVLLLATLLGWMGLETPLR